MHTNSQSQLLNNYYPLADSDYMSPHMLLYFKNKLETKRHEIIARVQSISRSLVDNSIRDPDPADQGAKEELLFNDCMFQERENRLLKEVEKALGRIKDGTYGYCESTGEPIGFKRLEAYPTARFCMEAQKKKESAYTKIDRKAF
jgi:DnaK suppressor protein